MAEYASKALGGTALGLAIPGTVAAVNQLLGGGGLGGLLGPGPAPFAQKEILDLKSENTLLKANQFTMLQTQPMQVEIARQGEQIACLQGQVNTLSNTVNSVIQPFVPNSKVVTPPTGG